jgi:hypothetical protein
MKNKLERRHKEIAVSYTITAFYLTRETKIYGLDKQLAVKVQYTDEIEKRSVTQLRKMNQEECDKKWPCSLETCSEQHKLERVSKQPVTSAFHKRYYAGCQPSPPQLSYSKMLPHEVS